MKNVNFSLPLKSKYDVLKTPEIHQCQSNKFMTYLDLLLYVLILVTRVNERNEYFPKIKFQHNLSKQMQFEVYLVHIKGVKQADEHRTSNPCVHLSMNFLTWAIH